MIPVQPEELSALIDGELNPQRAAEVEIQIAADQELRSMFGALRAEDSRWRAAARTGAFVPLVRHPTAARWNGWVMFLLVAATLVGVRAAVRVIDTTTIALAFQAVVLTVVLVRIAWVERSNLRPTLNPEL